jgi:acyl-CoA hydrolase
MIWHVKKFIKPSDLNAHSTLFGGRLIEWIDTDCAIFAMHQLGTKNLVTKFISEINFISPAHQCDIIDICVVGVVFGKTSISLKIEVRNGDTDKLILTLDKLVFVALDDMCKPVEHGKKELK